MGSHLIPTLCDNGMPLLLPVNAFFLELFGYYIIGFCILSSRTGKPSCSSYVEEEKRGSGLCILGSIALQPVTICEKLWESIAFSGILCYNPAT